MDNAAPKVSDNVVKLPLLIGFHYILSKINPEAADFFINRLQSGYMLDDTSPILHLRRRFELIKNTKHFKLTTSETTKLIYWCWEKHLEGKPMKSLKTPRTYKYNPNKKQINIQK